MSVSSSIDFRIVNMRSGLLESRIRVLELLIANGWSLINQNGYAVYLPIGDDNRSDWQSSKMELNNLMKILAEKEKCNEFIGVSMYWQNTFNGGSVLLWDGKDALQKGIHTPMAFSLSSNRKILTNYGDFKITDVNWYLERLLPVFNKGDTRVEYFTYEEHV